MGHPAVFRGYVGTIALIVTAVIVLVLLGDVVLRGGWWDAFLIAPWLLGVLWLEWVFLFRPCVRIDDRAIRLVNPFRSHEVEWGAVDDVVLRWQVELTLDDGRLLRAWGGPSGHSRARRPLGQRSLRESGDPSTAQLRRDPMDRIRERWLAATDAGRAVRSDWDVQALIALAVLVAWAWYALVVTGGPVFPNGG